MRGMKWSKGGGEVVRVNRHVHLMLKIAQETNEPHTRRAQNLRCAGYTHPKCIYKRRNEISVGERIDSKWGKKHWFTEKPQSKRRLREESRQKEKKRRDSNAF